jgi:hypothetical protein
VDKERRKKVFKIQVGVEAKIKGGCYFSEFKTFSKSFA